MAMASNFLLLNTYFVRVVSNVLNRLDIDLILRLDSKGKTLKQKNKNEFLLE